MRSNPRRRRSTGPARSLLLLGLVATFVPPDAPCQGQELPVPEPVPDLLVFVQEGCPHCARAKAWLDELEERRPGLTVSVRDVSRDREALELLRSIALARGLQTVGVPFFVVRGREVRIGFGEADGAGQALEELLTATRPEEGGPRGSDTPASPSIDVPFLGTVAVEDVGLPAFTVVLGLLDGFNPCAMWVLLFILSILVNIRSRARMALVGGVFVLVSGVVYYFFMAAWLNAFLLLGVASWVQAALGTLALLLGALNVKDFIWLGRGPSLGIPERAKPGIYERVRRVLTARNLGAALGTVVVLAALVNTVELLCTAGLPALFTRVLTLQELSAWSYYGYLALYIVFYMIDDALILVVAVVTLSHRRLQAGEARWLKLVSGVVMVGLGLVLLLRPEWLAGL